jgi:ABC-type lipoprotein export system ATPase subunit
MSQPLVAFRNVSRDFRAVDGTVSVLKDINFEVEPGSFTIIYGPSEGKTTILLILGLCRRQRAMWLLPAKVYMP